MSHFCLVAGSGQASAQDILSLAMRLTGAARELGMTIVSVKSSHAAQSSSRYITMRDARQRAWLVRVSNHRRPRSSPHEVPHFDLVSLDGHAGFAEAVVFFGQIVTGEVAWRNCWMATTSKKLKKTMRRAGR